jgi:hypothetical protein
MSDIVLFDKLSDVKRLTVDEAFSHLEKRFQTERGRYLSKMLDRETSPEETIALKAVVNALETLSPMALAEAVIKIESKNLKKHSPEMFKVNKKS